jgi:hypothetical protein
MAIPPIYRLIAKLLRANRRLKKKGKESKIGRKCNKIIADSEKAFVKLYEPKRRKYTHTPEYYAKRKSKVGFFTDTEGKQHIGSVGRSAPDPMPIKEQIALCAKDEELNNRENTALADAYSLFNTLNKQIVLLQSSTDAHDIDERKNMEKKRNSVKMIIKALDPKAMV